MTLFVVAMTSAPSFLLLPGEIRNKIYRYLLVADWAGLKPSDTECTDHHTVRTGSSKRWYDVHLPILSTCRQIYSEASGIFQEENTFIMVDYAVDYDLSTLRTFAPAKTVLDYELPTPKMIMTISLENLNSDNEASIRRIYMSRDIVLITMDSIAIQLHAPATRHMHASFSTHDESQDYCQQALLTQAARIMDVKSKTLNIEGSISPEWKKTLAYCDLEYRYETPQSFIYDLQQMLAMAKISHEASDCNLVNVFVVDITVRFFHILDLPHLLDPDDTWTYSFRHANPNSEQDARAIYDPWQYWAFVIDAVVAMTTLLSDKPAITTSLSTVGIFFNYALINNAQHPFTKLFLDIWKEDAGGLLSRFRIYKKWLAACDIYQHGPTGLRKAMSYTRYCLKARGAHGINLRAFEKALNVEAKSFKMPPNPNWLAGLSAVEVMGLDLRTVATARQDSHQPAL
ncbi:MAG: hypothetical protein Q9218_004069 [Villophora microphyllina]